MVWRGRGEAFVRYYSLSAVTDGGWTLSVQFTTSFHCATKKEWRLATQRLYCIVIVTPVIERRENHKTRGGGHGTKLASE